MLACCFFRKNVFNVNNTPHYIISDYIYISGASATSHRSLLHCIGYQSYIAHCRAYKVLVLTFQVVHNLAPVYITDLISVYEPGRQLRSASRSLLTVPRHNLERFGRRDFSVNAPHSWNDLPDNLRLIDSVVLFKRHLKTHLFKAAFSDYL